MVDGGDGVVLVAEMGFELAGICSESGDAREAEQMARWMATLPEEIGRTGVVQVFDAWMNKNENAAISWAKQQAAPLRDELVQLYCSAKEPSGDVFSLAFTITDDETRDAALVELITRGGETQEAQKAAVQASPLSQVKKNYLLQLLPKLWQPDQPR